jgi:isopentenyl-diphosphate delta-isomerase
MAQVILVDENDSVVGTMDKIEAHRLGKLHRAFSILVFNSQGKMILQKRAKAKYHSGGLWTNTCCSHPNPGEEISSAVKRQLLHEMGIDTDPRFLFKFTYNESLNNDMVENEVDYVFIGVSDTVPSLNPDEAEEWRAISLADLRKWIEQEPQNFTIWFRKIVNMLPENIAS